MVRTPPVEHHLTVFHFLQIAHSQRLATNLALDVGGGSDIMGWREEIEVMAVERITVFQESIAAGLGVDGIDRTVMVVKQHAHAWVVASKGTIRKGRIRSVVAVIGLAVENMFLEIPLACLTKRA